MNKPTPRKPTKKEIAEVGKRFEEAIAKYGVEKGCNRIASRMLTIISNTISEMSWELTKVEMELYGKDDDDE